MAERTTTIDDQFASAWNLSGHLITQIASLLGSASFNFRVGKIQQSFWDSEEITTLIYSFLELEEKKELSAITRKIGILNSFCNRCSFLSDVSGEETKEFSREKYNKAKYLHSRLVLRYRRKVNILLAKYHLGLSKKESSARMF